MVYYFIVLHEWDCAFNYVVGYDFKAILPIFLFVPANKMTLKRML